MKNESNINRIYNLNLVTILLSSSLYNFCLEFALGKKLKSNVVRWFNEMNTLTVVERVNFIVDNKYEEEFFRLLFSISNILVFLNSRFYEKSTYLTKIEEENKKLKEKIIFSISFKEQGSHYTFNFYKIFLKNLITRFIFFLWRIFLYAFFIFSIIFNIWTRMICITMVLFILCKTLYKFDIILNFEKTILLTISILIIISLFV